MTETEWTLRKELVAVKKSLLQAQFNLLAREDQDLGAAWPGDAPPNGAKATDKVATGTDLT